MDHIIGQDLVGLSVISRKMPRVSTLESGELLRLKKMIRESVRFSTATWIPKGCPAVISDLAGGIMTSGPVGGSICGIDNIWWLRYRDALGVPRRSSDGEADIGMFWGWLRERVCIGW